MATTTLPARTEIPIEQTWNLHSIFGSNEEWQTACKQLQESIPRLKSFQGKLTKNPQTLVAFLDLFQETGILAGKIMVYASNSYAVDTTDQAAAARVGQTRSLLAQFIATTAFLDPELMTMGFVTLKNG